MQKVEASKKITRKNYEKLDKLYFPSILPPKNLKNKLTMLSEGLVLSEYTLDVLIVVYSLYKKYKNPYGEIIISTDDVLFQRGIKKNTNQKGEKGGYKDSLRQSVTKELRLLELLELLVVERLSKNSFSVAMNRNFIKGNPLYALPVESVCFNPRKEFIEKRFCHVISYFKDKKSLPKNSGLNLGVKKFLKSIEKEAEKYYPAELRDRVETAFDRLFERKIINSWEYKKIDETLFEKKFWLDDWKKLSLKLGT